MAAVDPAIIVQLIDDDIPQIFETFRPFRVVGQDAAVQHIRIGEHNLGIVFNSAPGVLWCVAIGRKRECRIPWRPQRFGSSCS